MTSSLVILAGGKGTRIASEYSGIPKSMVPINGVPFIDWQLKLFLKHGFKNIVICVGHNSEDIIQYVGDGRRSNLNVSYSHDGSNPLGTGGALFNALPLLSQLFGVVYGDSYLEIDYKSIIQYGQFRSPNSVMTIKKGAGDEIPSNVRLESGVIVEYSKTESINMNYFDFGFSVLNRAQIDKFNLGSCFDLSSIFQELISDNSLLGLEVLADCHEIGSINGIKSLEKYLKGGK